MNLGVIYNQKTFNLPIWVRFAFKIGSYINEKGIWYKKRTKILISLPSNQYFSPLVAMGIVDKNFAVNKHFRSIKNTILNLEKGSRIIYQDGTSTRKMSVIGVEPSPVFENQMILKIKDKKFERGVPERDWINKIIILDEEPEEIKRTRKVSNKQQVGITDKPLLKTLYRSSQIQKASFYPGDFFYLIGNKERINQEVNEHIFHYEDTSGSIGDFLYMDNRNSYINGKLFSSKIRKFDFEVNDKVPVIFSDTISYMNQSQNFEANPQVIITSRTDSEARFQESIFEIKRVMLEHNCEIVTDDLLKYLGEDNIPNHIEFIAWRE